jgi:hypothetical protein
MTCKVATAALSFFCRSNNQRGLSGTQRNNNRNKAAGTA